MTHKHEAGNDCVIDGEFAGKMRPVFVGFDGLASLEVGDQKAFKVNRIIDKHFLLSSLPGTRCSRPQSRY